ncbi:LOB domain-containing protein 2 [Rhododendron vialii]|uniref:LOB domain-containing protein 2 n=1 Tax=Rhododendron vialii TaxID=182163 RepID=UPI00265FCC8B|nr:LOB domain-containing protein 2 [Rhododendron vialii]
MQRNAGMPACASCKHQRKKCSEKCVLAPYFPAGKNREFQAVHKLFGVSNVTKMLKSLNDPEDRRRASDTLVWEAFCRERDPVLGPYGEYRKAYEELKLYRSQYGPIQVQAPGSMMYKPAPNMMGWNNNNNNNGISNNNTNQNNSLNYNNSINIQNNDGSSINNGDSTTSFGYSSDHHLMQGLERKRQERELGSVIVLPQQHPMHSHQYYLSALFAFRNSLLEIDFYTLLIDTNTIFSVF